MLVDYFAHGTIALFQRQTLAMCTVIHWLLPIRTITLSVGKIALWSVTVSDCCLVNCFSLTTTRQATVSRDNCSVVCYHVGLLPCEPFFVDYYTSDNSLQAHLLCGLFHVRLVLCEQLLLTIPSQTIGLMSFHNTCQTVV